MDPSNKTLISAPMSLLNQVSVQNQYSVWFCDQNNNLIKVDLFSGNLTVSEAIKEAIEKFNQTYDQNLKDDLTCYELYGAKKNGKRKSDFPSLEYEQNIESTKLTRFHLFPLFPINRKHSEESTLTSIQSYMELEKVSPKKEIKTKRGFGCFFCSSKWSLYSFSSVSNE